MYYYSEYNDSIIDLDQFDSFAVVDADEEDDEECEVRAYYTDKHNDWYILWDGSDEECREFLKKFAKLINTLNSE